MNAPLLEDLDFKKGGGLIAAIAQDFRSGKVLMLAFMNAESYAATLSKGLAVFYSRSRKELWTKGETSGNSLKVLSISADCDGDALVLSVEPAGPACHKGTESCFVGAAGSTISFLADLDRLVEQRSVDLPEGSYTTKLLADKGKLASKKVGEEAVELALAAQTESDERVVSEAADLFYHSIALLRARGLGLAEVAGELRKRN
ncbi:MAG: bifunctional phosphoribosyl-AMP cyclohydrolase/phosphoribosyl-ATP diphosphatase [Elusimicrobia bacterium]|nr:MAG: bifunctional phosphoribosyl-AMP cyclohydrolase/phosphoribosyl-ATP diphosphatase [Elusimicrobiota bacterium]